MPVEIAWAADYNESDPHHGLGMKSPREYRAAVANGGTSSLDQVPNVAQGAGQGPRFQPTNPKNTTSPRTRVVSLTNQPPCRI